MSRERRATLPLMVPGDTLLAWLLPIATALCFVAVFAQPALLLARDWWHDPESSHGLLLAPVGVWLLWRRGLLRDGSAAPWLGAAILVVALALRLVSDLAAELFTMRVSLVLGLVGLTVYYLGVRQLLAWWLPLALLSLSIPLPAVVLAQIALPLQLEASRLGAALLELRDVPVVLAGNIIRLPGQDLFVTEACSGLRSLTALLSLAALVGGLGLRSVIGRVGLFLWSVPLAIGINAVRVFLTGYLVHYVSPNAGTGFLHATEGWAMFLVALAGFGAMVWCIERLERLLTRSKHA